MKETNRRNYEHILIYLLCNVYSRLETRFCPKAQVPACLEQLTIPNLSVDKCPLFLIHVCAVVIYSILDQHKYEEAYSNLITDLLLTLFLFLFFSLMFPEVIAVLIHKTS